LFWNWWTGHIARKWQARSCTASFSNLWEPRCIQCQWTRDKWKQSWRRCHDWSTSQRSFLAMLICRMSRMETQGPTHKQVRITNYVWTFAQPTGFIGIWVSATFRIDLIICLPMCRRRFDESFGIIFSQTKHNDFWLSQAACADSITTISQSSSMIFYQLSIKNAKKWLNNAIPEGAP
jgi:hypothetical protein